MENPRIVIIEFGSQYTSLIERSLREIGYRSAVLPPKKAEAWIRKMRPKAIIFSGSKHSVNDPDAPKIDPRILMAGIPILGICYGMQLIVKLLEGCVVSDQNVREYGPSTVRIFKSGLFSGVTESFPVWASHGDTVKVIPNGFRSMAISPDGAIAAIEDIQHRIWGVQFHPEVTQTSFGKEILANFVGTLASCEKDWNPKDMINEIQSSLRGQASDGNVILAFSGGVDSTALAALASPVIGGRLKAVCIDGNQLRQGELDEIRANADFANVSLSILNATDDFQAAWNPHLLEPPDPELKRKIFRTTYQTCLSKVARESNALFFIQGTLAPDMIESGQTGGDVIKTHHNVGVEIPGCTSLHPFQNLFKYEVRELAKNLRLPESVVMRQPFPGPGLAIRVLDWPTAEKIEILRWADYRVTSLAKEFGVYGNTSQLVVALDYGQFVGVKGDERAYNYAAIVRGVNTVDFMTATPYQFAPEMREVITTNLTKHNRIGRVFWDETPKPPGTVEFQ